MANLGQCPNTSLKRHISPQGQVAVLVFGKPAGKGIVSRELFESDSGVDRYAVRDGRRNNRRRIFRDKYQECLLGKNPCEGEGGISATARSIIVSARSKDFPSTKFED